MKKLEKKQKQVVAILLVIILLIGFLIPKLVKAFNLANDWNHPNVYPTWGNEPLQDIENSERFGDYKKTGMTFNENFYSSFLTNGWPLGAQMYLEERPGEDNSEYHEFNLKHTYCTGHHTEASPIQPGARAFVSGTYKYTPDEGQLFSEAVRGSNHKFNFLMLAIACYYPGDYKVKKDALSTADDPAISEGLVMQAIAWMATDEKSKGFSGNWEEDGEYHADMDLFVSDSARMYLTDIEFKPYGDWERTETTEDGIMHFKSPSGELDENGSIGYLYWPKEHIGYLMPIDPTKAKLYTFDTWNVNAGGAFGHTQTQFSSVIEKGLNIYLTIGGSDEGDKKVEVVCHEHKENWKTNYNINLYKFDSETGKPIEGSYWDVLEKFDNSQLNSTDLDRRADNPGSYESGLGSLISTEWGDDEISTNYDGDLGVTVSDTNRYNWGNDSKSQFTRWDNPYKDPCTRDKNITGADGRLYEIDSAGKITKDVAHTDSYDYVYYKGYCDGHPAPVIEYVECDHEGEGNEEECDCEEINQKLHDDAWEAWYKEVKNCEKLVEQGGFFHCIEPGEAAKKAMEEDRDEFYKDYISLTYEYSAVEIEAAKGYILHGLHTDDIPLEWRVVTSSEYKDTTEATNIGHNGTGGGTDEGDLATDELIKEEKNSSFPTENSSVSYGQQETLLTASKIINYVNRLKTAAETATKENTGDTEKIEESGTAEVEEYETETKEKQDFQENVDLENGKEETRKEGLLESQAEQKQDADVIEDKDEMDIADIAIGPMQLGSSA